MLNIKAFVVNMIMENCYVVSDDTKEAVIIDCGAFYSSDNENIAKYIDENQLLPKHHILTHAHFDHIFGAKFLYEKYGLKPELNAADVFLYNSYTEQTEFFLGRNASQSKSFNISFPELSNNLDSNSLITFGNHSFSVIPTPGHTPGGVSFYCKEENVLFSGDSLFQGSIGRTDFPYGDEGILINTLMKDIITLPESTVVYPGHGDSTTIASEKRENPFFTMFLN